MTTIKKLLFVILISLLTVFQVEASQHSFFITQNKTQVSGEAVAFDPTTLTGYEQHFIADSLSGSYSDGDTVTS